LVELGPGARVCNREISARLLPGRRSLGIELNPRAAAITELVLWIGYLQWHFRIRGQTAPVEPILRNFKNIKCRDALLLWSREELVRGPDRRLLTRWDGTTRKSHPITGEMVPNEDARVEAD
jgi:hypothetical protein